MKKRINILIIVFFALVLSSCGKPKEEPMSLKFGEHCKAEYADKYVALEGYVKEAHVTFCDDTNCDLNLQRWKDSNTDTMRMGVKYGKGKNTMDKLKDKFTKEDIKIRTNDNSEIGYGQPGRFIGKLFVTSDGKSCSLQVDRIEKIDEVNNNLSSKPQATALPEAQELSLADFCKDEYKDKFVKVNGFISAPKYIMLATTSYGLELHSSADRSDSKPVSVQFRIGNNSDEIEKLPKEYALKDIKIHTENNLINIDKEVNVYGYLETLDGLNNEEKTCYLDVAKIEQ